MPNYNDPWREREYRMKRAVEWDKKMREKYPQYIARAVAETKHLFQNGDKLEQTHGDMPDVVVMNYDSVTAAYACKGRTVILDFASYKNPGGMYIEGSIAQEESLCHESALFPILSDEQIVKAFYEPNKARLNYGLYGNNLLYVPAVPFVHNRQPRLFDVIVCAAPNRGTAQHRIGLSQTECDLAMRDRIRAVLTASEMLGAENAVFGAFGCGVFRNDPKTVAQMFKEELPGRTINTVFAVPGEKYEVFRDVLVPRENHNREVR